MNKSAKSPLNGLALCLSSVVNTLMKNERQMLFQRAIVLDEIQNINLE
jgi:hypothetical protein